MDCGTIVLFAGLCAVVGPVAGAFIIAWAINGAEERLSAQVGALPHHLAHLRIEALVAEAQQRAADPTGRPTRNASWRRSELS